ncbi:MAG TPA: MgtC/SapB family protein [Thermoanaerobaculales bacterium]|nr:MgtC/SapB family protein [Thermoanaerobaculales bacterium]HQL29162.1 MgtC/SapB family protein [Thermoanaerobaculales bacterium]HQN95084.1 MgtC/SapB family protein [Thermoanaerobaculales bacterium]HQP43242.1 MgtC/SapB family protein [Thermoanaerobaculales bacterium]
MGTLLQHLPPELSGFVLTLVLGLLIGFEREEHEPQGLGGVRTFPIIGLGGFLLVRAFPGSAVPFAAGLVALGTLVALSYWGGLRTGEPGITTETVALLTFVLGGAAAQGLYWVSIAAGVVAVILLQEKTRLESLAVNLPQNELRTAVRFLLLTGVILPAVPNQPFTDFGINPFSICLVVVAVSGISYLSYLLQRFWRREGGLFLAGLLGGAYSSTATTVALARSANQQVWPPTAYVGAIVAATGMMYLRLWVLVALFAPNLARELAVMFWLLGLAAIGFGALVGRRHAGNTVPSQASAEGDRRPATTNPLELSSALTFAGLFLVVLVVTRIVAGRFGGTGLLVMAAIMGTTDVDPFILGLTQQAAGGPLVAIAALAVVVAAAANNLMKGIYAFAFGPRSVGTPVLLILVSLAAVSIVLFHII